MNAKNCCAFVRVVQSDNGWTKPCGLDYRQGDHFAARSGFGFEEWMKIWHRHLYELRCICGEF